MLCFLMSSRYFTFFICIFMCSCTSNKVTSVDSKDDIHLFNRYTRVPVVYGISSMEGPIAANEALILSFGEFSPTLQKGTAQCGGTINTIQVGFKNRKRHQAVEYRVFLVPQGYYALKHGWLEGADPSLYFNIAPGIPHYLGNFRVYKAAPDKYGAHNLDRIGSLAPSYDITEAKNALEYFGINSNNLKVVSMKPTNRFANNILCAF